MTDLTAAKIAAFEMAVLSPSYADYRIESWRTSGAVYDPTDYICKIFHSSRKSPSGRVMAAVLHDADTAVAILRAHGKVFS